VFFFRDDKAIIFIHIPKTGGTSIKTLLERNGWKNKSRFDRGKGHPCHRDWSSIKKEFENNGTVFDYEFTLVRNPYNRIESRYWQYRRQVGNSVPLAIELASGYPCSLSGPKIKSKSLQGFDNRFIGSRIDFFHFAATSLFCEEIKSSGYDDNHFLPQHKFISDKTVSFKLEEKNRLLDTLSHMGYIGKDSKMPHVRSRERPISKDIFYEPENVGTLHLNMTWSENDNIKKIHDKFLEIYFKDFKKFGYEINE